MPQIPDTLTSLYPALAQVQPSLSDLGAAVAPTPVPAGTELFSGKPCQGFPLVLAGDGRSLELYRVGASELCLVSSACLFRVQPLSAHGVTTRASTLIVISPLIFDRWLDTTAFRNEVLGLFAERMADLNSLVDAVWPFTSWTDGWQRPCSATGITWR
jgi:CRP/FNR family transcriptional regulator